MEFIDWLPAISTTSLLAFVLWLMRSVISTRLVKSVQHEFDEKLENLRSENRKKEEFFKADLLAKGAQIDLLRSGALSALVSRQAVLDKRRIEAVDQLWSAFTDLAHVKAASDIMSCIKFEESLIEAEKNPQFKKIFEMIGKCVSLDKIKDTNASKVRPFVSEISWAIFSAYQAIVFFSVTQLEMLKIGLNKPELLDTGNISKLVEATLPHQSEYLKKYGSSGYYFLLGELESRLLKELQNILEGKESDKTSVEQAAIILKEADRVMEKLRAATPNK